MRYLGSFDVDEDIILSVQWTPLNPEDGIDASELTLTHASSTDVLGPLAGVNAGVNAFEVTVRLPRAGRWIAEWVTEPSGGVDVSSLYVE